MRREERRVLSDSRGQNRKTTTTTRNPTSVYLPPLLTLYTSPRPPPRSTEGCLHLRFSLVLVLDLLPRFVVRARLVVVRLLVFLVRHHTCMSEWRRRKRSVSTLGLAESGNEAKTSEEGEEKQEGGRSSEKDVQRTRKCALIGHWDVHDDAEFLSPVEDGVGVTKELASDGDLRETTTLSLSTTRRD